MDWNEQRVFEVVRSKVLEVLDVSPETVTRDTSLTELGANSIDRAEVAITSMEELGLKIPRSEFAGVVDLDTLVRLFCSRLEESSAGR